MAGVGANFTAVLLAQVPGDDRGRIRPARLDVGQRRTDQPVGSLGGIRARLRAHLQARAGLERHAVIEPAAVGLSVGFRRAALAAHIDAHALANLQFARIDALIPLLHAGDLYFIFLRDSLEGIAALDPVGNRNRAAGFLHDLLVGLHDKVAPRGNLKPADIIPAAHIIEPDAKLQRDAPEGIALGDRIMHDIAIFCAAILGRGGRARAPYQTPQRQRHQDSISFHNSTFTLNRMRRDDGSMPSNHKPICLKIPARRVNLPKNYDRAKRREMARKNSIPPKSDNKNSRGDGLGSPAAEHPVQPRVECGLGIGGLWVSSSTTSDEAGSSSESGVMVASARPASSTSGKPASLSRSR